jgi:hypothetical protein
VATFKDLARHADPRTTIKHYTRTRLHDLRQAVPAVPVSGPDEAEELRAEGTYGRAPNTHQTQRNSQPSGAQRRTSRKTNPRKGNARKSLPDE